MLKSDLGGIEMTVTKAMYDDQEELKSDLGGIEIIPNQCG